MTKQSIIDQTIHVINELPNEKAEEISDFANYLLKRYEESLLSINLNQLYLDSKTFDFLNDEEELYSLSDIKEKIGV
jgi:hypothetical protein